ncbi:MAG: efflux RND transporter permease subunit [Gammaproteobacteria bacterium]|nr:efflux RND transporter permease subunit [Gammaproteobacteria bacterium]
MNLPGFCIHRPAFTIVISLLLIIVGVIGYMNLPIRWIPSVIPPEVSIQTAYPGANAKIVEKDVTKVIEEMLSGLSGVETLTSASRQGESQISITFKLGKNMDTVVEDVRSSIERVRGILPREAENPIVRKADPDNQPIMYVSFFNPNYSPRELSDYVEKYILPSFETIEGVGNAPLYGKRNTALRVALDPLKMASSKVSIEEVNQALQEQSLSLPTGQIRGIDRNYSVVLNTALKTEDEFNHLIIRKNQNQLVRLSDIGDAKFAPEDTYSAFRVMTKPALAIGIVPQSTANPLDVEQRVQKTLADLKRSLPAGMIMSVEYNQADYIRASIHSVYESFIEAILFVWIVIFAFLCSFRATLIPIITIPVCLIASFAFLYFLGFSINTLTLMALVLAIGLVVDDAIVMLENVSRHIENGLPVFQAALIGSKEIIFPIIAMTITLTAVYAPIAFTPGLLGVLFREFTFTLAGAVLISGIVALTLSPMMCARFLKATSGAPSRYSVWLTKGMTGLQNRYKLLLQRVFGRRKWVMLGLILTLISGFGLYHFISAELSPAEDMNEINVYVMAPRSASFEYTDSYVRQLEAIYSTMPEIESFFSQGGRYSPSFAYQVLKLKPKGLRTRTADEIIHAITSQADRITGIRINVFTPKPALAEIAQGDSGDNLGLVLMTTNEYADLQKSTQQIMELIRQDLGFVHVENGLKWDTEQFELNIERDKIADLNVSLNTINNTLSTLIAGKKIGKIDDANILVQMKDSFLTDPNLFQQLYVRNLQGNMIALSQLVSIKETVTSQVFRHYNRLRSDTIAVTLAPTFKLADAIKKLETIAKANLPDSIKFSFTGEAKSFLESNGKVIFTFTLALIFIYLVLVAQFESFIDPFVILFTVPFAVIGAFITLKLFGGTFNIYSNIGLITLIGLVAKHGILITDFANRLRREGYSINDAIIQSAMLRIRPILMTTAAMILGAMPLAFAYGPGAESRQQIGLVITGGLFFGTVFSLFVVPVMYTYFAPFRKISILKEQT